MTELSDRFRHIAIEGPIGVGKTSLAEKMASLLKAGLVLEEGGKNPFLERFYRSDEGHALSTQLFFFYQRLDQLQSLNPGGLKDARIVTDYLFEKNSVFANLTLDQDEKKLYQRICEGQYPHNWPKPDLVIWLQADPQTLLSRIHKRGIQVERRIDEGYLERLSEGYAQMFQGYDGAPVFAINTQMFNPVDNAEHFSVLIGRLCSFRGAREYFNPQL